MSEWNEDYTDMNEDAEIIQPQDDIEENEYQFPTEKEVASYYEEADFYGNQQIYNSSIVEYTKDMNSEDLPEEDRKYAEKRLEEVEIEKQDAIDKWKESHGQYDEERTELLIGEKTSEEIKEQEINDITDQESVSETQDTEAVDIEIPEQNEVNLENLSYDELREKYKDVCAHNSALGEAYAKYDKQIAEISRDKPYYSSENEWNSYLNEKFTAQNEVSVRRNQIQSEMRELEREMDSRKRNN